MVQKKHGFGKELSCISNLLSFFRETIRKPDEENVEVCYLDFQKAFHSVNDTFLLHKLGITSSATAFTSTVKPYLCNRSFHVNVKENRSTIARAANEILESSALEPVLCLVNINDLLKVMRSSRSMYGNDVKVLGTLNPPQTQEGLVIIHRQKVASVLPINVV